MLNLFSESVAISWTLKFPAEKVFARGSIQRFTDLHWEYLPTSCCRRLCCMRRMSETRILSQFAFRNKFASVKWSDFRESHYVCAASSHMVRMTQFSDNTSLSRETPHLPIVHSHCRPQFCEIPTPRWLAFFVFVSSLVADVFISDSNNNLTFRCEIIN